MDPYPSDTNRSAPRPPAPTAAPQPDPAVPPGLSAIAAGAEQLRLDAALFTDKQRVLAMVTHWSRDELYTLGNTLVGEGDRRIEEELLEVLRDRFGASKPPVTHVEFVTDPNYPEQVYWSDQTVYAHVEGHTEPLRIEFSIEESGQEETRDERFRSLLADYARADPPSHGHHLAVNLATGDFDRSGPWSRA